MRVPFNLKSVGFVFLFCLFAECSHSYGPSPDYDVLIRNGTILDGTGAPGRTGDVGISGDRIAGLGDLVGKTASRVIDAQGLAVCPGFIDIHTHSDRGFGKPETTANLNYVTQGVTTLVVGNCGSGSFNITQLIGPWEKTGIGTNAVILAGFGTIRNAVMGIENRPPSAEELERMKALLREAMAEGAWGMSTALAYISDRYARRDEVVALAKVVAEFGGVYSSHIRDEGARLLEAIEETIHIGRESGVPVNVSHLKASGKRNWGMMKEAVRRIGLARKAGVAITADMYPYHGAAIVPFMMSFNVPKDMPSFADLMPGVDYFYILNRLGVTLEDMKARGREVTLGRAELLKRYAAELERALTDPARKGIIRRLTLEGSPEQLNWVPMFGWDNFLITSAKKDPSLIGRIFSDVAEERKKDPFDLAVDLVLSEKDDLIVSVCVMSEDDIRTALRQDWLMIGSDGGAARYKVGNVHPRYYGSAARVLGKYSRDEGILPLEQAVRKMTGLPAQFLRLKDRGLLKKGFMADVVVFDPETVRDRATYQDPHQLSLGVEYVLINGRWSVDGGTYNGALNGRILLHTKGD